MADPFALPDQPANVREADSLLDMARTIRLGEGFPAVDGSVERSVSRTTSWERASLRPIAAWHAVGGTWTQ